MEKKETIETTAEVITDIICDSCGESCKIDEFVIDNELNPDHGKTLYSFEYMKLEAGWGYHTKKDLEHWTAQICEKCVDEKLSFINFSQRAIKFETILK